MRPAATMKDTMTTTMHRTDAATARPISVLICALGGEGGGVLADWLTEAARIAGFPAQATSVPGVAQRTGATTYFFEMLPLPLAELHGRRPVFSLNAIPGALDVVVSSELLESARCASNGLPSPERTVFISSTARTLTTNERSVPGDGRLDSAALISLLQSVSREHHLLDMQQIAREQGTVVSAVMFGALAASGVLPLDKAVCLHVIEQSGRGAAASQRGFEAAWQIIAEGRATHQHAQAQLAASVAAMRTASGAESGSESSEAPAASPPAIAAFPAVLHELLTLGYQRLRDYQDKAYAALYLSRMQAVVDAEAQTTTPTDPSAETAYPASRETARWLALWMAYDDIVRVADLKSRASRHARVHREVRVGPQEITKIYDHFKPGIAEIAAMLPRPLAERLRDWDRQRVAEDRPSWAMPVKLASHTVSGLLLLRVLAGAKYLRRFSSRYADEQQLISEWLSAVREGLAQGGTLGLEIALCGRLIKGYGSTHDRGRENLLHILRHLAAPERGAADVRAEAIRRAREAALADATGKALDRALNDAGAPARPLRAQPIRWMRRATTSTESSS